MEQILYYTKARNAQEERLQKLGELLQIGIKSVSPLQTGQTIGYLAGYSGFAEKKSQFLEVPPPVGEELLILDGFSRERLDLVLKMLKESGVYVELKAVVTPHNIGWTLGALYAELCRERKAFQQK